MIQSNFLLFCEVMLCVLMEVFYMKKFIVISAAILSASIFVQETSQKNVPQPNAVRRVINSVMNNKSKQKRQLGKKLFVVTICG